MYMKNQKKPGSGQERGVTAAVSDGPDDDERDPLAIEIGAAIRDAIAKSPGKAPALAAALGITPHAVKKIKVGQSTKQYAKLARMCRALGITPNEILGFNDKNVLAGVLQVVFHQLGLRREEAEGLTEIVLKVVSSPPVHSSSISRADSARAQAEYAVREFYRQ